MRGVRITPSRFPWERIEELRAQAAEGLATPLGSALKRTAVAWLVSRALLALATLLVVPLGQATTNPGYVTGHPAYSLSDLVWRWYFWDGSFYAALARGGYSHAAYTAWFPLWPGLMHVLSFGADPFYAGLALAQFATLAACVLLTALAFDWGLPRPELPAILLLAAPFAFFLAAPYTEGLFIALAAGALLALRHARWFVAALLIAFAAVTRPTGLVLVPVMLLAYGLVLARARRVTVWDIFRGIDMCGLALVGITAYCVYCHLVWHDALIWLHVESSAHDHGILWPWQGLGLAWSQLTTPGPTYVLVQDALALIPLLATIGVLAASVRRLRLPELAFGVGIVLMCLCSPMTNAIMPVAYVSAGRYMLSVVPLWLILARWSERWPALASILISGGIAVQAILLFFELNNGWLV